MVPCLLLFLVNVHPCLGIEVLFIPASSGLLVLVFIGDIYSEILYWRSLPPFEL